MTNTKSLSTFGYVVETLAVVGLLFHVLLVLGTWDLLPASIPIHYNFSGEADAWGDRNNLLWLFGLSLVIYSGLTFLGRCPHKFNYPWQITAVNATRQYVLGQNFLRAVKCEVVWLLAVISLQTVAVSLGLTSGLGSFFVASVIAITGLTAIGYVSLASRSAFGEVR